MTNFGGISGEVLRNLISKIEKLEEEKKEIGEFITDAYREAKSQGFDAKAIRAVVALRKKDPQEITEQEELIDIYKHALGM